MTSMAFSPSPRRHAALPPPPHHRRTLSSTLIDESVEAAAAVVNKWHPDDAPSGASLFLDAEEDDEPQRFLRAAADLHRAMLFFASDTTTHGSDSHGSVGLIQAQALLETAMRRLDLELKVLLDDDVVQSQPGHTHGATRRNSIRAVAKAMMAAGYGRECVSTFKSRRRAALATALQRLLGFPPTAGDRDLHKLTWDQLDGGVIPSWLATAAAAFGSLFPAEKHLCDAVFSGADAPVGKAVFTAVANDQATGLLAVAEAAAARARRAPERLFRVLDVHDALTAAMPALLSAFGDGGGSGTEVAARAATAVAKVGDAARGTLAGLEAAMHKESSKSTAAGGAVHPLTRYVMNYLVFLADYRDGLALLYDSDVSDSDSGEQSSIIHRLVSALLGKLEAKAGCYREVALSYLFLANNTRYVASKVAAAGELRGILGEGWAEEQGTKAQAHVAVYVRAAWGKVTSLCSSGGGGGEPDPAAVEAAVMEAVGMQEQWAAADEEMGEALRAAAAAAVVPKYRMFYRRHGAAVRLTPGDVAAMIAALFGGPLQRR